MTLQCAIGLSKCDPAPLALALCLLPLACSAEPATFEVVYVEAQDRSCAASRGYDIRVEWLNELNEVLPGFRKAWKTKGPAMFDAVTSLTRRSSKQFAVPVRLSLCDTPSQSFSGPSVNMRYALTSFTTSPVPLRYKVDTAFHESLHGFHAERSDTSTPHQQAPC